MPFYFKYGFVITDRANVIVRPNSNAIRGPLVNGLYQLPYDEVFLADHEPDDKAQLWHARLGHVSLSKIKRGVQLGLIKDPDLRDCRLLQKHMCPGCAEGSCHARPISQGPTERAGIGERAFMDNCGPVTPPSYTGKRYFNLIVDDKTRLKSVRFMRTREETLDAFKLYHKTVVLACDKKLRAIRTDPAPECCAGEVKQYCQEQGITQETTVAEQHTQNAVVERGIGIITEMARCSMLFFNVPAGWWPEAVAAAVYVNNRLPCDTNTKERSPLQAWSQSETPPTISHLRVFGCYAVFKHTEDEHVVSRKFGPQGIAGAMMGYEENRKGYRVLDPVRRKV